MFEGLRRESFALAAMPQVSPEQTRQQNNSTPFVSLGGFDFGALNLINQSAVLPPTFDTYRKMRAVPTVALARAAATCPMIAAGMSYKAGRDNADDKWVKLIQTMCERLWPSFIRNACYSLDYGFKPFEQVYSYLPGTDWGRPTSVVTIDRLKPLNVDKSKPVTDKDTGALESVENYGKRVPAEYILWIRHDAEDDNWYGRSRMENIRTTAYAGWMDTFAKEMTYINKVAGVIPMIEYPPGAEKDMTGTLRPNYEIANMLLQQLKAGRGITMPNVLAVAARDLLERGVSMDTLKAWSIKFLEASGQHGGDFVQILRHHESGIMRGWIVPERVATEGQQGTKAEAVVHTDLALVMAEQTLMDIAGQFNEQVVDRVLVLNFGEEARGAVVAVANPLNSAKKALVERIITTALQSGGAATVQTWLDVDAMLDELDLPKVAEIVPMPDGQKDPEAEQVNNGPAGVMAQLSRLMLTQ